VTVGMIEAFEAALDEVEAKARAMVLTGAGRAFCSGANLSAGTGEAQDPDDYDAGLILDSHINPLMSRLRDLKLPWITAVRGAAAGVGASLALAADMILASDTAYFLQAFPRIGLVPDGGSSHLLVRTLGRPRAMEMMLLGERLPAATALSWGLINRLVPDDQLDAAAAELAQRLADGAASLKLIRRLAWTAVDEDWSASLAAERALQREAGRTRDHREGVAAFLGKRAAQFEGR
jgi:2-(1,2-epoxy-1,2-dihydrophenyl)acetyl-CoA isomerase